MSLQERTLVIKNFDPEKTSSKLLKELCIQGGPVRNVIVRPDHAFVEYEDIESVGYSKALLDGVVLFGKKLILETKMREPRYFKYTKLLNDYIRYDKEQQRQQQALLYQQQMAMMNPPPQQVMHPMSIQPGIQPYMYNVSPQMPQGMSLYQQQPQLHHTTLPHSLSMGSIPQYPSTMEYVTNNPNIQIHNINSNEAQSAHQFNVPSMPSTSRSSYNTSNSSNSSNTRRSRSFNNHQNRGTSGRNQWERGRR